MDLFFIEYQGQQVEISPAPNGQPETYIVHLPEGQKTITPYELNGKRGWRFVNEEISTAAQHIGELIEKSFIIRVNDKDLKTLDEYFGNDKKKKE